MTPEQLTAVSHLTLELGKHKCHCGEVASHLMRCKVCRAVVARCGGHGHEIVRETEAHCAGR